MSATLDLDALARDISQLAGAHFENLSITRCSECIGEIRSVLARAVEAERKSMAEWALSRRIPSELFSAVGWNEALETFAAAIRARGAKPGEGEK